MPKLPDHIVLQDAARYAFGLGLQDAKSGLSKPKTREQIQAFFINAEPDAFIRDFINYDWRKGHWTKIRQVYGAGFDIEKLHDLIEDDRS